MMRFLKKPLAFLLIGMILGVLAVPSPKVVRAESGCLDQFGLFLSSLTSFDEFQGYWDDILRRNRCQQADIFALDDEVEALMQLLREEYIEHCASEEITEMQQEIREKKMEIHFIRYIVPIHGETNYKQDVDAYEANFELVKQNLLEEMIAKYVTDKDWVEKEELTDMFNEWVDAYEDRIPKYHTLSCNESPWEEVQIEWEEFMEKLSVIKNAQSLGERAQEIKEEYEKEKQERNEEANIESGSEKDGNITTFKAFLAKHIDLKVKGIEKLKKPEEIAEEAAEEGEVMTNEQFQVAIEVAKNKYFQDNLRAELLGDFETRYQYGTADITDDFIYRINELEILIQTSATSPLFLPGLQESAKKVHKKQGNSAS